MILNLLAGVAQSLDLGEAYGYVKILQTEGTEPVYVNTKTVAVADDGALLINPSSEGKIYRFDEAQVFYAICSADATLVIEPVKKWSGSRRRTLTANQVSVFSFPSECRSIEITNFDDSDDVYFAFDRDPDSAEEWTGKVKASSGYYPSQDVECFSVRLISAAAVEVEVRGYPKVDPLKRTHNTRR